MSAATSSRRVSMWVVSQRAMAAWRRRRTSSSSFASTSARVPPVREDELAHVGELRRAHALDEPLLLEPVERLGERDLVLVVRPQAPGRSLVARRFALGAHLREQRAIPEHLAHDRGTLQRRALERVEAREARLDRVLHRDRQAALLEAVHVDDDALVARHEEARLDEPEHQLAQRACGLPCDRCATAATSGSGAPASDGTSTRASRRRRPRRAPDRARGDAARRRELARALRTAGASPATTTAIGRPRPSRSPRAAPTPRSRPGACCRAGAGWAAPARRPRRAAAAPSRRACGARRRALERREERAVGEGHPREVPEQVRRLGDLARLDGAQDAPYRGRHLRAHGARRARRSHAEALEQQAREGRVGAVAALAARRVEDADVRVRSAQRPRSRERAGASCPNRGRPRARRASAGRARARDRCRCGSPPTPRPGR